MGTITDLRERRRQLAARQVVPLPRADGAPAHAYIDGRFYCSFRSLAAARDARALWLELWAAAKGRRVEVRKL